MTRQEVSHMTRPATLAGLAIALLLPFLTYAGGQWVFGAEQSQARVVTGLVVHWCTFAAVVALVLFAERLPLSSIGVRPFRWWTLPAGVTVVLFTLAHVPAVGFDHLLPVAIVSVFVTLLYLWRRDLILNMVAHATIDAIGLLLAPILAR
jgi:membrane protease YdiL (CAAX protease family)